MRNQQQPKFNPIEQEKSDNKSNEGKDESELSIKKIQGGSNLQELVVNQTKIGCRLHKT